MKEIVIKAWCDACWQDGEQRTPSTRTYTAGIVNGENRPALRLVELCEVHDKLAIDLMALLSDIGTVPDFKAKPPVKLETTTTNSGARLVDCPVCNTEQHRGSLVSHIWSNHRSDPKPKSPDDLICPECRTQYDSGQGLAAHRRSQHGYDAVADALSGVKGYHAK